MTAKEFISKAVALIKYYIAKYRAYRAEQERLRLEKQVEDTIKFHTMMVDEKLDLLKKNSYLFDKKFLERVLGEVEKIEDISAKFEYIKQLDGEKLKSNIARFNTFLKEDARLRGSSSAEIEVESSELLYAIDQIVRNNILEAAVREHWVDGSSNAVAVGASMYRGNYASAAQNFASGVKSQLNANAFNSALKRAFYEDIFNIRFVNTLGAFPDEQRKAILFAWRLVEIGIERQSARLALFALVFNNGNCRAFPPNETDSLSKAMVGELVNRFRQYILAPREAVAKLEEIRKSNNLAGLMYEAPTLKIGIKDMDMGYFLNKA